YQNESLQARLFTISTCLDEIYATGKNRGYPEKARSIGDNARRAGALLRRLCLLRRSSACRSKVDAHEKELDLDLQDENNAVGRLALHRL
ncbi:MAG TPA: hypothetical protein PK922_14585, partial [Syntrophorhabdus sp.]|nr:hypothetical protein [Syntrophorhabdus sp.]